MSELDTLRSVLSLLAAARFDTTGKDLMQIANVIDLFAKYVASREAEEAPAHE